MTQGQDRGPQRTGQSEKSLLERVFPSAYTLWRMLRRSRSTPAAPDGRQPAPQPILGSPVQLDQGQQQNFQQTPGDPLGPAQSQPPIPQPTPSAPIQLAQAQQLPSQHPQDNPVTAAQIQTPPPQQQPSPAASRPRIDDPSSEPQIPRRPERATGVPTAPAGNEGRGAETSRTPAGGIDASKIEVGETTDKACEELRTAQTVRAEAADIRERARRVLDEAEAIQVEAERVMAQARRAFAKAEALNPDALKSAATTISTLEEAIRTERHLRRMTRQQAEEGAEWAHSRAADAILNALSAVRTVSNDVSRELDESNRIRSTADSIKDSSRDDLKRAQAIMSEAERRLMKHEARRVLDESWADQPAPPQEMVSPPRSEIGPLSYPQPHVEEAPRQVPGAEEAPFRTPVAEPMAEKPPDVPTGATVEEELLSPPSFDEAPAETPRPQEAPGPKPAIPSREEQPPISVGSPEVVPAGNLDADISRFLRSFEEFKAPSTQEEVNEPAQAPSQGFSLDNMDFLKEEPVESQGRQSLADNNEPAEAMEGVQHSPPPRQPSSTGAEGEFGDDVLAQLRDSLANVQPVSESPEMPSVADMEERRIPSPPPASQDSPGYFEPTPGMGSQPVSVPSQSLPLAENYSGILHIIFAPAADPATLSFFWDVIDAVAGVGKVVAQMPLADGSGHEFTLDLGNDILAVEQLKARIPGAEVLAVGQDRLRIQLGPMAD